LRFVKRHLPLKTFGNHSSAQAPLDKKLYALNFKVPFPCFITTHRGNIEEAKNCTFLT
jgi:hypothetical protein